MSGSDEARVRLCGDLDLASARRLAEVAAVLLREGVRHVVLDAAAVGFADSEGLKPVVRLDGMLRALGGSLVIERPSARLSRVLAGTGLLRTMTVRT